MTTPPALTLAKYSLLATLRSPTSVVFSILFPVIFIVVFGSMVDQSPVIKLALAGDSDTSGIVYKAIMAIPSIQLKKGMDVQEQNDALQKGRITAVLHIKYDAGLSFLPHYTIRLEATGASSANLSYLKILLHEAIRNIDEKMYPKSPSVATLSIQEVPGKAYRQIDFILPGQLGFSLLMAGVFGSSFLLFNLRQGLVLKRIRATPVRRRTIIAGEMLSRLFFHLIGFILMVSLGYFAFHFTLVNGLETFLEMLVFSLFGLGIFMGIGFIISGTLHNESSISPVANTVTLPQILLCGLFFPIESYPHWLQGFCNILPLTFFVDGLRKIAFEGVHLWQLPLQLGALVLWTVVIGAWSVKAFKWE
ncbi:MAG TPA: ABC transporter permease [Dinghuibacter sp.]|jgi:ABC-2 type transport system permease protein|uniref:ABC transporter permease n=1 Tax=Dinghuibacter sp. TaxID=2024697 RepID=UPI002C4D307E|nr:ABC transporter permease [Dinghuibacter sp.]HTJ12125.1 ABC transporter permease [Dinghuibacter sp.]